uniref:J domain-containing protein n=1 Tax=Aegilops tauschii subsp. strangulata TaxID=200361 RepID=A0A453H9Q2_AEGTS
MLFLYRSRGTPYTDAEVKNAFRTKAMEVHPDQNQDNRETAEEEFKEVVKSYEAIKLERKNNAS